MTPNLIVALIIALGALLVPAAAPIAAGLPDQNLQAQTTYSLSLSKSSDRANPSRLEGQTVSGSIYVFVSPDSGATQVRFYLDNTSASGIPFQTENNGPYDFAGGSATVANPFDTNTLSNGQHTITAAIDTSSGTATITSTFTVSNGVAATATPTTPPATATSIPTAAPAPVTSVPTTAPATATKAPTAIPTNPPATATPSSSYSLMLSQSSSRSGAAALQGQTVAGNIYVFVSPDTGAGRVRFYIDNTAASGTPFQTENNAPYDLAGGSAKAASPYNSAQLSNGQHTITAAIDLSSGGTTKITSTFTVNNSMATATAALAATAAPTATKAPATATAAPTATKAPATATPAATATSAPAGGSIYWGVNIEAVPWDLNKLSTWERDITGKAVSIIHWGHFWDNGAGGYRTWSNGTINNARAHGSIPMISWTPEGGDNSRYQLGDIIRGDHDAYIRQFATDAKNWGYPFFLRIMHEMNGSWGYPWQETQNGNSRGEFVQAWRRIIDIFNSVGVTNASYVWCPNIDYPGTSNPTFASLYPGDTYVDWTCLDGYNWGSNRSSGWQTFDQVFNYSYNEVLKVAPSKPFMIGEFGSVEQGGSKANWFTDALRTQLPTRYPKVRAAVYFNWPFDGVDWRIETSTTARDAWRAGIGSSYYYANQFGNLSGGKVRVP